MGQNMRWVKICLSFFVPHGRCKLSIEKLIPCPVNIFNKKKILKKRKKKKDTFLVKNNLLKKKKNVFRLSKLTVFTEVQSFQSALLKC